MSPLFADEPTGLRAGYAGDAWWWTGASAPWNDPKKAACPPRRQVVERTFGWLGNGQRLSKDDEALPETEENPIYLAMTRLVPRRILGCFTRR